MVSLLLSLGLDTQPLYVYLLVLVFSLLYTKKQLNYRPVSRRKSMLLLIRTSHLTCLFTAAAVATAAVLRAGLTPSRSASMSLIMVLSVRRAVRLFSRWELAMCLCLPVRSFADGYTVRNVAQGSIGVARCPKCLDPGERCHRRGRQRLVYMACCVQV